ncbi:DUF2924 domain-containing protein [Methylobacterium sp. Leaf108]|uniref:DUF2924 domain-containing protein n=1 Tax=Methylobacterium sp. Leaf108 TaxID=1736256 RepID=UPI0006FC57A0|nr:DUF2924 domain-containing protein [Methylobacterium sp. Leaf108]KQP60980.1 hypothetical protein ASF39_14945 [Methylobacterium sp. Leaf108]
MSAPLSRAPRSGQDRIEADLARLASADLAELRRRWRRLVGRPAPEKLSRAFLHRLLAYRLQAAALGDLDRESVALLDRLGPQSPGRDGAIALPARPVHRPGTLLVREWQGQLHRVTVLDLGFAWEGRSYDSLSKVARAITGTNWNGPRFFGLREKTKPPEPQGARITARATATVGSRWP